ncbi:hypothetical protein AN189_04370 [Loktanella sp. 3ANDIMAR09]|uniref:hypothetical protein n=1 Tax=Loktanella sp. 3ANDIMAR09 TaxID=1225657 RepID=UPI000701655B|nr:hypothetical protein [Loktanella sp. 3ANDIMAR09]KQI69636.1 hypothetical protein AN189_04370 [Loktanella sp. 3ANDIMAR09]
MRKTLKFALILSGLMFSGLPLAAQACPNPDMASFTQLTESGVSLRRGKSVRMTAGGMRPLGDCPQASVARGSDSHFTDAPTFELNLVGMMGLALQMSADTGCARDMLVQTADGSWYYRGPGLNGFMPPMMLSNPGTGALKVWIGTQDDRSCRVRMEFLTLLR